MCVSKRRYPIVSNNSACLNLIPQTDGCPVMIASNFRKQIRIDPDGLPDTGHTFGEVRYISSYFFYGGTIEMIEMIFFFLLWGNL